MSETKKLYKRAKKAYTLRKENLKNNPTMWDNEPGTIGYTLQHMEAYK